MTRIAGGPLGPPLRAAEGSAAASEGLPWVDEYPLAPMQQAMLLEGLADRSPGLNLQQLVVTLDEALDPALLRQGWRLCLGRHAILRTAFAWRDLRDPVQRVFADVEPSWRLEDWRGSEVDPSAERFACFLEDDRQAGFSLDGAPLLRFALFRTSENQWKFVWTFHHALLDGRSTFLVLREAFANYESLQRRATITQPPAVAFRDYVAWARRLGTAPHKTFWRQRLHGWSGVSVIPATAPEVAVGSKAGHLRRQSPRLLADQLAGLAASHKLTPATLVLGAWAVLLSRHTGETEVSFGVVTAGRYGTIPGATECAGCFIHALPWRASVAPDQPLIPWLRELRAQWLEMREHEHVSPLEIGRWSEPARHLTSGTLLVSENYELNSRLRAESPAWSNRTAELHERPGFSISLGAVMTLEGCCFDFLFDGGRYTQAHILRLSEHLENLLQAFALMPDARLGELPMLSEVERRRLFDQGSARPHELSCGEQATQLLDAQVARTPAAVAVEIHGVSLTYRHLHARARCLAAELHRRGVGPNTLVGLCAERSVEMVVGLLGILKAGAACVPLDPAYPAERLKLMIGEARPAVTLVTARTAGRLPASATSVLRLDTSAENDPGIAPVQESFAPSPADAAYVIFTSGSTGRPKGVVVEHRSLANYVQAANHEFALTSADRVLQFASLSFDISVEEIFCTLTSGATLVLRDDAMLASIRDFLDACHRLAITVLDLPTAFWHELVAGMVEGDLDLPDSIRLVIIGGESARTDRWRQWCKRVSSRVRLINCYGPTEATVSATWLDLSQFPDCASLGAGLPIGRPVPGVRALVLGAGGGLAPIGVWGELHLGGVCLARGYLNRPELTAEKFVRDPFSGEPGARLYRTGDRCRWRADGVLEFLGRLDEQVKIRGYRVEPGEIESVLATAPAVAQAAVVVAGEGAADKRLVAGVVARPGEIAAGTEGEWTAGLRGWLQERLPGHLVPGAIVALERLPLTPNGKLDRQALARLVRETAPEAGGTVPLEGATEQAVAAIWAQLLGVAAVGATDDFFALGGHSLLAVRLVDGLMREFGVLLPLPRFLASPQVRSVAREIDRQRGASRPPPDEAGPAPFFLIGWLIQPEGFFGPEHPLYVLPFPEFGDTAATCRIEHLAGACLRTLRTVRPRGPYLLGGYSVAGLVAYEMARRLREAGEEVALLALIDTGPPPALTRRAVRAIERWGPRLGLDYGRQLLLVRLVCFLHEHLARAWRVGWRRQLQVLRGLVPLLWRRWRARGKPAAAAPRDIPETAGGAALPVGHYWRHVWAHTRYQPQPYAGELTLLATEEMVAGTREPGRGWGRWAAGVREMPIPGNHSSCVRKHRAALAARLQQCCAAATQGIRSAMVADGCARCD